MAFPPQFLDEIRTRISVSSVVGRRAKLIRRGREFVCLSPFTNEKTPSFTINDDKGFYHCFSSGEHGDIFKFVMKIQNLSFPEAVERLAEEAGLEMPRQSAEEIQQAEIGARGREALEAACKLYEEALRAPEGRRALEYLKGRGLSDETIKRFRLGYAPSGNVLKTKFFARGVKEDVLLETRLLSPGKEGRESFDFFRNRVMFPIFDLRGRPVAFGGRVMDPEEQPKYLNSPDTPLFHKGQLLYGMALAREAAAAKREIIVAEGYMDVIALAQAGFTNAVAPLGTAMTESQLELLWRMASEPILCFDGDKAGRGAALRAAERAFKILKPGISLRFAMMPAGKDPDDICRNEGPQAMAAILDASAPLSELIWEDTKSQHQTNTPERRAGLDAALMAKAGEIADDTVRMQYRRLFRDRLFELFRPKPKTPAAKYGSWGRTRRDRETSLSPFLTVHRSKLADTVAEWAQLTRDRILLATLLSHPGIRDHVEERLGGIVFSNTRLDMLRQAVLAQLSEHPSIEAPILKSELFNLGFTNEINEITATALVHAGFAHWSASLLDAAEGWDDAYDLSEASLLAKEKELSEANLNEEWDKQDPQAEVIAERFEKMQHLHFAELKRVERPSPAYEGRRIRSKRHPQDS